ncbi:MAG: type II toxin-antitoxin system RelE/ParE family toxin [Ignavibacteria bacterium]|jgi:phage-related protein|nr:type II toxin-antitoxin system RelE/ParE family toxin [Ignavibacteria bacterium]
MVKRFKIEILEEAAAFLDKLDEKSRDKVIYNIKKAEFSTDRELSKKLKGEIWEFRTLFNKTHYRLLAFWDKTNEIQTIVVTTHGFVKKTGKVPQSEIDKAERIRNHYFKLKRLRK